MGRALYTSHYHYRYDEHTPDVCFTYALPKKKDLRFKCLLLKVKCLQYVYLKVSWDSHLSLCRIHIQKTQNLKHECHALSYVETLFCVRHVGCSCVYIYIKITSMPPMEGLVLRIRVVLFYVLVRLRVISIYQERYYIIGSDLPGEVH